jgi:hypothetical protein
MFIEIEKWKFLVPLQPIPVMPLDPIGLLHKVHCIGMPILSAGIILAKMTEIAMQQDNRSPLDL